MSDTVAVLVQITGSFFSGLLTGAILWRNR